MFINMHIKLNKYYKIIEYGIEYLVEEYSNGSKYWILNDKIHRETGPARILSDGTTQYWLNNIHYPDVNSVEELLLASIIL
jgi:hypothetical protein